MGWYIYCVIFNMINHFHEPKSHPYIISPSRAYLLMP